MWAPAPPYLTGNPFPKGVLALVEKVADVTNLHIDTAELIAVDAEYTEKVDEALANSGTDLDEYLEDLEGYDEPLLGSLFGGQAEPIDDPQVTGLDPERTDALVDKIVRFLEGDAPT